MRDNQQVDEFRKDLRRNNLFWSCRTFCNLQNCKYRIKEPRKNAFLWVGVKRTDIAWVIWDMPIVGTTLWTRTNLQRLTFIKLALKKCSLPLCNPKVSYRTHSWDQRVWLIASNKCSLHFNIIFRYLPNGLFRFFWPNFLINLSSQTEFLVEKSEHMNIWP